ncbi:MAG: pseudaminic acid biosynthesis-associated methylase [Candidatus Omnitrophica bacterium]|nr:pseudaminic acid biosynthesis-associated methylase [Candidatus Omnitrophota bacterium]
MVQEDFWRGAFGDDYTQREKRLSTVAHRIAFLSQVLKNTEGVRSVIEFGANIGINLLAIKHLLPQVKLSAVEINHKAAAALRRSKIVKVYERSIFDFKGKQVYDFVLVRGLLIHVNPHKLGQAYDIIHAASHRYICVAEYYNPTPIQVKYRGHSDVLFKRDFAGEMLDRFPNLRLIDYGFIYHRDPNFPQDDLNWFLLEKRKKQIGVTDER